MQRRNVGRDLMDLEADMRCLKKQLKVILDENHFFKVKIRRLENEALKKNKYISYLHSNSQKSNDRRFIPFDASNAIIRLKRENEQLREMLLKKDIEDQKRTRNMKTVLLYRQLDNKPLRKPLRKSMKHFNGQISLDNDEIGSRKLDSLSDSNTLSREYYRTPKKDYYTSENHNMPYKLSYVSHSEAYNLMAVINLLKEQHIQDSNTILKQSSNITQLTTELFKMRQQLKMNNLDSESACFLFNNDQTSNMNNFIEGGTSTVTKSVESRTPEPSYRDVLVDMPAVEHKKTALEPVQELSEDEIFATNSNQSETNLYDYSATSKFKTLIEYLSDSEVSSDEEAFEKPDSKNCDKKSISTMF